MAEQSAALAVADAKTASREQTVINSAEILKKFKKIVDNEYKA